MIVFRGSGEVEVPDELIIDKFEIEEEGLRVVIAEVSNAYVVIYEHFSTRLWKNIVDIYITPSLETARQKYKELVEWGKEVVGKKEEEESTTIF